MSGDKHKILIVDDESGVVKTLNDFLSEYGYSVSPALTGEDALDFLKSQRVDLVLLDLRLPGLQGGDVARIIKSKYPDIKIIVLTGYAQDSLTLVEEKILECVLIKPVGLEELRKKIETVLEPKPEQQNKILYLKIE